jgi:hypothetical protein
MAYNPSKLSVLAYANGFTLWHYSTSDSAAAADTAGYFNKAADMLRTGDMILVNVETGGTPGAGLFVVAANQGASVDVTNLTPFGTANSD